MAKRKSINYPGFKHENPIPNASRIGNILMSSIISGRDPETSTMPTDLARYAIEVVNSLRGKSNAVLSQATTREMLTPGMGNWGLGLQIGGSPSKPYFPAIT